MSPNSSSRSSNLARSSLVRSRLSRFKKTHEFSENDQHMVGALQTVQAGSTGTVSAAPIRNNISSQKTTCSSTSMMSSLRTGRAIPSGVPASRFMVAPYGSYALVSVQSYWTGLPQEVPERSTQKTPTQNRHTIHTGGKVELSGDILSASLTSILSIEVYGRQLQLQ